MGLFVFGLILAVIGLILIACFKIRVDGRSYAGAWIGGGALAIVLALAFIIGSMYNSVPARAVGVPINFGKIGTPLQSGVHWQAPWISITTCPLTEETDIQNTDPNSGSSNYNQAVRLAGSDQGGATADVTVQYHIDAADAGAVYSKFKCNLTLIHNNLIVQRVRSDVANAAAQFLSTDLKTKRASMEGIAKSALQTDLQPFGITVDDLVISTIVLDQNVQDAANAKLAAQQNALTQTYNLQAAQKQAQINATKQHTLSAQVLCEDWIQMMQAALTSSSNHISVLNTAGPCSAGSSAGGTSVLVNPSTPNG